MEDDKLLKISLATACIGIFMLFIIMEISEPDTYSIEELDAASENEEVMIYGKIESIRETEKVVEIAIIENKIIRRKALRFKENEDDMEIDEGDVVKIQGSMYQGDIVIEDIERYEPR
jgi:translation initiation factor IF-1